MWREKGSETEREKVRVEAEVEEMQQKKMLSEEEKRRCVQLIVNMVFKSPYQGWQILLNRFFYLRCLERLEKATSTLQGFKVTISETIFRFLK